jgi:hypothetical protein
MNEFRGRTEFFYSSEALCIVFGNMRFTQDGGQLLHLDGNVSALLLSGQIVTLLWGDCLCNDESF